MKRSYDIHIKGLGNLEEFVNTWSPSYVYPMEDKYNNHVAHALETKEAFIELFKWKNGTGDKISQLKMKTVLGFWDKIDVLRDLKSGFRWDEAFNWEGFEREFQPQRSSTIWKLFLLHLVNPYSFPIFDQHVYRAFKFFKDGVVKELPSSLSDVYQIYKGAYKGWFNELHNQYGLEPKKMDESFFAFGKMLKTIYKYPNEIIS